MTPAKRLAIVLLLLAFLPMGTACNMQSGNQSTHDDAFSSEALLKVDAQDLRHTIVTPHLEAPITEDLNVLWCGSFQLAWNQAVSLVKEDLHFEYEPAMVEILNKQSFTKDEIDARSCVVVADSVRNKVFDQIQQKLDETFEGRATPRYVPPRRLTPHPQDIVVYSYLFKNLEFPIPFAPLDQPLRFAAEGFGTKSVPCFGIGRQNDPKNTEMLAQIAILDYQSENDFVIELKTRSTLDRLILAKVQPLATLGALVNGVVKRAANAEPVNPHLGDILEVPKLNFDITREYKELEDQSLLVTHPNVAHDLVLVSALQNIRFQLDEVGVRLKSESHMAYKSEAPPPPVHIMIFDRPFLIMMQRSGAKTPYFALWVGNPELLVNLRE